MKIENKKVDFDDYAENYEELVSTQLAFFSKDRSYFSSYKIELLARKIDFKPKSILDFGSGIGLSIPFFRDFFPWSEIYASDLSINSLEYIKKNYSYAEVIKDQDLEAHKFDCIFLSGVVHHITDSERNKVFDRISKLLNPNGILTIFEHNPYNPVTQRMVSTCEFDHDAELITKNKLIAKVSSSGNFKIYKSGYCLFFPQFLKKLNIMEKFIEWLPFGGQYFCIFRKTD